MRIISGNNRGKKINIPNNLPVRPTTDQSKEALFNILNNHYLISEIKILDLFSGSGNISYEFASRGCNEIYSVDRNIKCVKFIKKISNELNLNLNVIKADALSFIKKIDIKFDVIFADPPYNYNTKEYSIIIDKVFEKKLLNVNGLLIIEHSEKMKLDKYINYKKSYHYGGCSFSFFKI